MSYYFNKVLLMSFDDVVTLTAEKLKEQGFGIITEIDVTGTFKAKLGAEFKNYKILGACNPAFAHQALSTDPALGVLLPCNVVVYEEAPGKCVVGAVYPLTTLASATDDEELSTLAGEVKARLDSAMTVFDA